MDIILEHIITAAGWKIHDHEQNHWIRRLFRIKTHTYRWCQPWSKPLESSRWPLGSGCLAWGRQETWASHAKYRQSKASVTLWRPRRRFLEFYWSTRPELCVTEVFTGQHEGNTPHDRFSSPLPWQPPDDVTYPEPSQACGASLSWTAEI